MRTRAAQEQTIVDTLHDRATPAGGARKRGRGCVFKFILSILTLQAGMAAAGSVDVPSGQSVTFLEALSEEVARGQVARYRFVAPAIGTDGGPDFEAVMTDMEYLCSQYALPLLTDAGVRPQQIIVSLSSESLEFGVASLEVTQYFEAYSAQNGLCIWEVF